MPNNAESVRHDVSSVGFPTDEPPGQQTAEQRARALFTDEEWAQLKAMTSEQIAELRAIIKRHRAPHPDWCVPALCTADGVADTGEHLGEPVDVMNVRGGWSVHVQPVAYVDYEHRGYGTSWANVTIENLELPASASIPVDGADIPAVIHALHAVRRVIVEDDAAHPLDPEPEQ